MSGDPEEEEEEEGPHLGPEEAEVGGMGGASQLWNFLHTA